MSGSPTPDRLADESGFTLIELLVSITIGIVVLIGLLNLVDSTGRANARLADKTETVQRTRIGMDRIVRILRTQVCADTATPPLIEGTANSVTFYSDVYADRNGDGVPELDFLPTKVRLTYDSAGKGTVTQETWDTTSTGPPWSYPTAATRTRVLIDNVGPAGTAFLTYYGFADLTEATGKLALPLDTSLSADPLPANSVAKVVKIDVGLQGRPVTGNTDTARRTQATSSVYTRNADFSVANQAGRTLGARCG